MPIGSHMIDLIKKGAPKQEGHAYLEGPINSFAPTEAEALKALAKELRKLAREADQRAKELTR